MKLRRVVPVECETMVTRAAAEEGQLEVAIQRINRIAQAKSHSFGVEADGLVQVRNTKHGVTHRDEPGDSSRRHKWRIWSVPWEQKFVTVSDRIREGQHFSFAAAPSRPVNTGDAQTKVPEPLRCHIQVTQAGQFPSQRDKAIT